MQRFFIHTQFEAPYHKRFEQAVDHLAYAAAEVVYVLKNEKFMFQPPIHEAFVELKTADEVLGHQAYHFAAAESGGDPCWLSEVFVQILTVMRQGLMKTQDSMIAYSSGKIDAESSDGNNNLFFLRRDRLLITTLLEGADVSLASRIVPSFKWREERINDSVKSESTNSASSTDILVEEKSGSAHHTSWEQHIKSGFAVLLAFLRSTWPVFGQNVSFSWYAKELRLIDVVMKKIRSHNLKKLEDKIKKEKNFKLAEEILKQTSRPPNEARTNLLEIIFTDVDFLNLISYIFKLETEPWRRRMDGDRQLPFELQKIIFKIFVKLKNLHRDLEVYYGDGNTVFSVIIVNMSN